MVYFLIFPDDPDSTCILFITPNKIIITYFTVVAMSKSNRALTLIKKVVDNGIMTRFNGYNLYFTVTFIKDVVAYFCIRIRHRPGAGSNPDGFATIHSEWRARTKIVMIYFMVVWLITKPNY
ncbi:hypothetical protein D3C80_1552360 [compost metagenome]